MRKQEDSPNQGHVVLFVPGTPANLTAWRTALADHALVLKHDQLTSQTLPFAVEVEWVDNPGDGSFGLAFSFGTASEAEQRHIDSAPGALVLTLPVNLHRERSAVARLGRALATCGALAVRVEQSKVGFPIRKWIELVEGDDPWSLYRAAVMVLSGEERTATCGMHVFSLPDASVANDGGVDVKQANQLLASLNVYQVAESPLLVSGHAFSPDADTARRELRRWPDDAYPPGHPCHNPYGVWRLGAPGAKPRPPGSLAFVFMPALVALLESAEEKAGKPLTRAQVEAVVSGGACITMSHEHARELEWSRGYADLDPELAWEQWQARAR